MRALFGSFHPVGSGGDVRYFVTRFTATLTIVGLLFVAIGLIYLSTSAPHLPSFFPGHVAYSRHPRAYTKRGVAMIVFSGIFFFVASRESKRAMGDW